MLNIKLKFYGIFNDYLNNEIDITFNENINLHSFKNYISKNILIKDLFFLNTILDKSVFSNGIEILSLDYMLKNNDIIYLLPPFSGG